MVLICEGNEFQAEGTATQNALLASFVLGLGLQSRHMTMGTKTDFYKFLPSSDAVKHDFFRNNFRHMCLRC